MPDEKVEKSIVATDTVIVQTAVLLKIEGVGRWFAHLGDDEQATFLQAVAEEAAKFEKPACFQWQYMTDRMRENKDRAALDMLGEWGAYAEDMPDA